MHASRVLALAALAALVLTTPVEAQAADTAVLGGPGGSNFRSECPSGQLLAGLEFRTGNAIDGITALCAPQADKGRLGKSIAQKPAGSTSGRPRSFECATDRAVSILKVSGTKSVVSVQITCSALAGTAATSLKCISPTGYCRDHAAAECAASEVAVGIHGRASKTIDALGLICGPRPGAAAQPDATAEAPGEPAPSPAPAADAGMVAAPEAAANAAAADKPAEIPPLATADKPADRPAEAPAEVAAKPATEPPAVAAAEPAPPPAAAEPPPALPPPEATASLGITPVVHTALKPGDTFRSCPECPEMVVVPAGTFTMGSPDGEVGRQANESPQRSVTIPKPFAVGKYEVTFDEWDHCVAASVCPKLDDKGWGRGNRPVINVGFEDAQRYVMWLSLRTDKSYRMPSEAEWEYAARAGSQGRWSFGDDASSLGQYAWSATGSGGAIPEGDAMTRPVGSKKPNAFGLYDMHGNVYEYVWDFYHSSYAGPPTDGSAWEVAPSRVIRGGAWNSAPENTRSAHRFTYPDAQPWIGFRVSMVLDEPSAQPDQRAEAPSKALPSADDAGQPAEAAPTDVAEGPAGPPPAAEPPAGAAGEAPATDGEGVAPRVAEPPASVELDDSAAPEIAMAPPPEALESARPAPGPIAPDAATAARPGPTFRSPPPKRMSAPDAVAAPPPAAAAQPPALKKMAVPAVAPDSDGKWRLVPVFFGTDRKPLASTTRLSYGFDRARKLELGRALVSIPTAHQVPNVERPWALTIPGTSIVLYEEEEDPAKHFTMREIKSLGEAEFLTLVKDRIKGSKDYKDQALIFIHGYNSTFDNAVYRTAQIAHDLSFDGASFLYSWPSRGELSGYTYDRVSNEQAEPFLRDFVQLIVQKSGAKQVSVIAHSMGNQLALRVLRELKTAKVVVNQIILAAPDVDRDTFENIAKELQGLSKGITLYAAANDKALIAAKSFHGGVPRAGDVPPSGPVLVQGVDTIDVTALSMDSLGLNHSTYAERTDLIDDIARLLRSGTRPPLKRTPTLAVVKAGAQEYWKFQKK